MCRHACAYAQMMVHSKIISSPHNKNFSVKLSRIPYTKFFYLWDATPLSVPLLSYSPSKAYLLSTNLFFRIHLVYILFLSKKHWAETFRTVLSTECWTVVELKGEKNPNMQLYGWTNTYSKWIKQQKVLICQSSRSPASWSSVRTHRISAQCKHLSY